jgi:threonyl-tRNA synthetase
MEALAQTVTLTLPDGSRKTVPSGTTLADVAAGIGPRLAKDALAGKLDGKLVDLATPVRADAKVEIVTARSPEALALCRHSTAHLTANAVKRSSRPSRSASAGSRTAYYYDFDPGRPFTPEDLQAIEAEMRRIVAEVNRVERLEMSKAEAIEIFRKQGDTLKVEIVDGIPEEKVSCYRQKDFIDLCRGPHVASTGKLGVFKLTHRRAWKGDEKNPMLQRIYAACFLTQKELDDYLKQQEQARARDHRKLGKELDLIVFHPWAPASPFFLPKGAALYNGLIEFLRSEYGRRGYQEVVTPQIFDVELFKTSGHYANRDNMSSLRWTSATSA